MKAGTGKVLVNEPETSRISAGLTCCTFLPPGIRR